MQGVSGGVGHPYAVVSSATCSGRQLGASWQTLSYDHALRRATVPAGACLSAARRGQEAAGQVRAGCLHGPGARARARAVSLNSQVSSQIGSQVKPTERGTGMQTSFFLGGRVPGVSSRETLQSSHRFSRTMRPPPPHRPIMANASANQDATAVPPAPPKKNIFSVILVAVRSLWKQVTMPLGNFGFGKRSIWEGGVGLFLMTGVFMSALLFSWVRGVQVRAGTSSYQAVFEFAQACGITVGTPVRIRGVDVGSVVGVRPSLERIDVVAEILDTGVVIPRNSLVEVNQSGLISETLIDITPRNPIPKPTVGPDSPMCEEEGLIVCDRQRIVGQQGVSLDELVGICTKLAKQMDEEGMHNIFRSVDKVTATVEDAKPLLDKVTQITTDLQPLLKELSEGELLKNLEGLTKVATEAASDLRELNSSVLTTENTKLLRDSVSTLTKTLKHVESISEDVSILTGDSGTRYNLKQLIESLSRLVND